MESAAHRRHHIQIFSLQIWHQAWAALKLCLKKEKEGFHPLGRVSISLFATINKMQMQTGYALFSWKSYQLHRVFFLFVCFKLCFLFLDGGSGWNYDLKKTLNWLSQCLVLVRLSHVTNSACKYSIFTSVTFVFRISAQPRAEQLEDCCWCFTKSQFLILLCSLLAPVAC